MKHILAILSLGLALLSTPALSITVVPVSSTAQFTSALGTVNEGEIIELAAGTYTAPSGGWTVSSPTISFTIRGEEGQTVTLSGSSSRPIFKIFSSGPGSTIVFQNLIFANGFSDENGSAGAVTLNEAAATFIDCEFNNNEASPSGTGGGGVAAFLGSTAHFFGVEFNNNRALNEGGGLKVGGGSSVYVHDSEFFGNLANIANHRPTAAGGGIHVANSLLHISNTRFDSNETGCLGAGLYSLGGYTEPTTIVKIVNSTFIDNKVEPDSTSSCTFDTSGGALHGESNVNLFIYNSRFLTNSAETGGAFSLFRANAEIYDSIFRGNLAHGAHPAGRGGTISSSSQDLAAEEDNHPSSVIKIRDSFFQGRYGGVAATAVRGGCLWMLGDTNRTYGLSGVQQMGSAATNRATLDIAGSVFYDCDAVREEGTNGTGVGGAAQLSHVNLTLDNSLVMDCDVTGTNADGGGIRMINEATASITNTTFARNTAVRRGGALNIAGSHIEVDGSQFFLNDAGTDGAAIVNSTISNGPGGSKLSVTGEIRNSIFKNHGSLTLRDLDTDNTTCEINEVVYNNNEFYTDPPDGDVYLTGLVAGNKTASEMNSVTVVRTNCTNTVKSTINNTALGSEPDLGALLAVPPAVLPVNAAGDPAPPTESLLSYAWCGSSAALNGIALGANTGVDPTTTTGMHTLVVGSDSFVEDIADGPTPTGIFAASPVEIAGGESSDLSWSSTAGTFLCLSIDRGVEVSSQTTSGSETVTPGATRSYNLHLLTEEGGVYRETTVYVDEPAGDRIFSDDFETGTPTAWSGSVGL